MTSSDFPIFPRSTTNTYSIGITIWTAFLLLARFLPLPVLLHLIRLLFLPLLFLLLHLLHVIILYLPFLLHLVLVPHLSQLVRNCYWLHHHIYHLCLFLTWFFLHFLFWVLSISFFSNLLLFSSLLFPSLWFRPRSRSRTTWRSRSRLHLLWSFRLSWFFVIFAVCFSQIP